MSSTQGCDSSSSSSSKNNTVVAPSPSKASTVVGQHHPPTARRNNTTAAVAAAKTRAPSSSSTTATAPRNTSRAVNISSPKRKQKQLLLFEQQQQLKQRQTDSTSSRSRSSTLQDDHFFGIQLIASVYLVFAFCICLQFVASPAQVRQLTQASLATPNTFHPTATTATATTNTALLHQELHLFPDNAESSQYDVTHYYHAEEDDGIAVSTTSTKADGKTVPSTSTNRANTLKQRQQTAQQQKPSVSQVNVSIQQGELANGIKYYHCGSLGQAAASLVVATSSSSSSSTTKRKIVESRDLVILGGSLFFEDLMDNYENGGHVHLTEDDISERSFLELCYRAELRGDVLDSITALDLGYNNNNINKKHNNNNANTNFVVAPTVLLAAMEGLLALNMVSALPVAALVTLGPAAAGTVLDWILYGDDVRALTHRVARRWISVSAGDSVVRAVDDHNDDNEYNKNNDDNDNVSSAKQLHSSPLHLIEHWPVMAVYGSVDAVGQRGAQLLQTNAPAAAAVTTAEVEGGPLCYLDSPVQFSDTIMDYMELQFLVFAATHHP